MASLLAALPAGPGGIEELQRGFDRPPGDARVMMRWWWFGPAVTRPELEREMRAMRQGGIGGFEVQPVYPLVLDDPAHGIRNLPYLSNDFLEALKFTGEKAKELGLRMDLTLASGWPYGGPHIPIAQAAGKLRIERLALPAGSGELKLPAIGEGEKFIAAFVGREPIADIANGALWSAPAADSRTVLVFISSRTRQAVKRAAVGAEGLVLDHYDRAAIDAHLQAVGEKLLGALGSNPPYAVFSDSLEVYGSDWTPDFLQEFARRRGYDLTPYLPALAGDIGVETGAIRHDWGRTLTELADENYLTPLRQWAARHGTRFRSQTYGVPPVALSSNALVDLPEGEGSAWRGLSATRWASSASHLYGRPVTSSETWTWLHSPVFSATPLDMKAEADLHFLQGINQLIGHGWPYSPPEAGEPGWRFYAAAVFNAHNPWWPVMPDITAYLNRLSFLLRQGQPVNDVAVYLPTDDAWAHFTPGHVSLNETLGPLIGPHLFPQILDAGYNFDLIDDRAILHGGVPYRILILPGVERIPMESYRAIEKFAAQGGVVIATRRVPSLAPGLAGAGEETRQVREMSRSLFPSHARLVEEESALGGVLRAALQPDMAATPGIGFVHRKLPFAEIYFLANTTNRPVRGAAVFRQSGLEAAWWDAATGKVSKAGGAHLELDLAPYESRVVVFSSRHLPEASQPGGALPAAIDLSAGWKVTIGGVSEEMAKLKPWSDEDRWKYFSGAAIYEKSVTLAPSARPTFLTFGEGTPLGESSERRSGSGMRAWLDGPVREAAEVFVNGKRAGAVWCPPYEVEVAGLLQPGANAIRVVVYNLAVNELAKVPLPDYAALTAKFGERFQAQDMNLLRPLPSGLLGPVRLVAR